MVPFFKNIQISPNIYYFYECKNSFSFINAALFCILFYFLSIFIHFWVNWLFAVLKTHFYFCCLKRFFEKRVHCLFGYFFNIADNSLTFLLIL